MENSTHKKLNMMLLNSEDPTELSGLIKVVNFETYEKLSDPKFELTEDMFFTVFAGKALRKFCEDDLTNLNLIKNQDYYISKKFLVIKSNEYWYSLKLKDAKKKQKYLDDMNNHFKSLENELSKPILQCRYPYNAKVGAPTNWCNLSVNILDFTDILNFVIDKNKYWIDLNKCVINRVELDSGKAIDMCVPITLGTINNINFSIDDDSVKGEFSGSLLLDGTLRMHASWGDKDDSLDGVKHIFFNFDVIENKKEEESNMIMTNNKFDNEITSTYDTSMYYEPDKVKAIRETIEAVMKNTGKTDLKDIDLDMLSSCINATFNREKLFYKWLGEFTSDEVDDDKAKFAFKFLDWVIQNKIDSEKTNGIYFKE